MELSPGALANVLESGAYPKTEGHLHDGRGYCCLGVYADKCGLWADENAQWVPAKFSMYGRSDTTLGTEICPDWMLAEIPEEWIERWSYLLNGADQQIRDTLVTLNDTHRNWLEVIYALESIDEDGNFIGWPGDREPAGDE